MGIGKDNEVSENTHTHKKAAKAVFRAKKAITGK